MNVLIELIDTDSGEIISRISRNLVFDPSNRGDVGFKLCRDWIACALRGVRNREYNHDHLELRFRFYETQVPAQLFVNDSRMKIEAAHVY